MIHLKSNFIQSELSQILQQARNDQEVATSIGFVDQQAANRFANLCNQVVFDTTLDMEMGEEDITDKLRQYMLQNTIDQNIEAVGSQVTMSMPKGLVQEIAKRGNELGVKLIQSQESGL